MNDQERLQHLLDELHASDAMPEEVCASYPELLPQVRARWLKMRRLRANLDVLFPTLPKPDSVPPAGVTGGARLRDPGSLAARQGVVYRAWHCRLQRPVALKMLLAAYAEPPTASGCSAGRRSRAGPPNIVQIYDVATWRGPARWSLRMETLAGSSAASQPARQAAGGARGRGHPGTSVDCATT